MQLTWTEIDVSTTSIADLIRRSDAAQLVFIQRKNRVIVTHDDDFLRIVSIRNDCLLM